MATLLAGSSRDNKETCVVAFTYLSVVVGALCEIPMLACDKVLIHVVITATVTVGYTDSASASRLGTHYGKY